MFFVFVSLPPLYLSIVSDDRKIFILSYAVLRLILALILPLYISFSRFLSIFYAISSLFSILF